MIPLGADKTHDCKSEAHLIETYCKKQFFQQYDSNTLILRGPTLGSDHCGHSPWHQGVKVEEVGRGEGTPFELVIFAYHVRSILTSKQIELESPGCSGFEGNSNTFPTIIYFLIFHIL